MWIVVDLNRCESVVMSDHPTHRYRLLDGGPGLTRSRGAGFLLCTPRSRLRGDPLYRRVPSVAGSSLGSTGVYPQQPATMRGQSGFHVLGPEAGEAISGLDHDRTHGLLTKERQELAPPSVQDRPHLGHHPANHQTVPRRPGRHPRHLPIEITGLVGR
jgi:hypothetical protein